MEKRLAKISRSWVQTANGRIIHKYQEYIDFFWFWLLGAYEVTRVMKQMEHCFQPPVRSKIGGLNVQLAKLRMPLAKQEARGKKGSLVNPEVTTGKAGIGLIYEFG
ncbi:MAG: hypothetical protein ACREYE_07015, partial [Gammaproteobacteria bacterium]